MCSVWLRSPALKSVIIGASIFPPNKTRCFVPSTFDWYLVSHIAQTFLAFFFFITFLHLGVGRIGAPVFCCLMMTNEIPSHSDVWCEIRRSERFALFHEKRCEFFAFSVKKSVVVLLLYSCHLLLCLTLFLIVFKVLLFYFQTFETVWSKKEICKHFSLTLLFYFCIIFIFWFFVCFPRQSSSTDVSPVFFKSEWKFHNWFLLFL